MTPEEIIETFATGIVLFPEHSQAAKDKAIEAMKQWGKDLCEEQKRNSLLAWGEVYTNNFDDDGNAILNAPYPKEIL